MNELEDLIYEAKKNGLTDQEIGDKFNVNLRFIEKTITKRLGINVSNPTMQKIITNLQPKKFIPEASTVWSFKSRGKWATHNGNYRGNWSPYIPRNIILRYSNQNDIVLDCFCGAGTTGVECKLTNRNFIGIDINPKAIELAIENVNFPMPDLSPENREIELRTDFRVGDARDLSFIKDETIDLICTHPPYADIIHYTDNQEQDLSFYTTDDFLKEMSKVAKENYRVLKNSRYCAVLIGDMRKKKNVIPLGFWLIDVYLKAGFSLKELIIKRQHNCKTTGFWYKNSIEYNFLLLAHEYLAVFKKDSATIKEHSAKDMNITTDFSFTPIKIEQLESTTVWLFSSNDWYNKTVQNIIERYDGKDSWIINGVGDFNRFNDVQEPKSLVIININNQFNCNAVYKTIDVIAKNIMDNGFLAIICGDGHLEDGTIFPTGIAIEKNLKNQRELKIKEIVVLSIENDHPSSTPDDLNITHKYLFVYRIKKGGK